MLNPIRVTVILSAMGLLLLPKVSYAWDDRSGRDAGHAHHGHGFHAHVNPDLTLVTGMDDIDSRVLVDSVPDPAPEETDQAPEQGIVITPPQMTSLDTDGNFIINVPNNAGGYTPVRIQKWGNGYIGPQGELYYPFPEISQLKAIYGV